MKWTLVLFILCLVSASIIYPFWAETDSAVLFGNVVQIIALLAASYNLTLVLDCYERDDEPRKAWFCLALGMWIWVVGQVLESYCDLVLKIISYGTIADAFWSLGYLPFFLGAWRLVRNYQKTGLPMGSKSSYVIQGILLLAIYLVIFFTSIWPQLATPDRSITLKFLDFFYSTSDFVLVCFMSVLVRIAWMMRGGSLARAWILLCIGFSLIWLADLQLSYTTDYGSAWYRLNDVTYFSAYFVIALAGAAQVKLLKSA